MHYSILLLSEGSFCILHERWRAVYYLHGKKVFFILHSISLIFVEENALSTLRHIVTFDVLLEVGGED